MDGYEREKGHSLLSDLSEQRLEIAQRTPLVSRVWGGNKEGQVGVEVSNARSIRL